MCVYAKERVDMCRVYVYVCVRAQVFCSFYLRSAVHTQNIKLTIFIEIC